MDSKILLILSCKIYTRETKLSCNGRRKNPDLASTRRNDPTCLNIVGCPVGVLRVSGECLECVWMVSGVCLERV